MDITPQIKDTVPVWLSITLFHHYILETEISSGSSNRHKTEWEEIREYEQKNNLPPIIMPEVMEKNQTWTKTEIDILIKEFDGSHKAMADRLGRTVGATSRKIATLREEGRMPCTSRCTKYF